MHWSSSTTLSWHGHILLRGFLSLYSFTLIHFSLILIEVTFPHNSWQLNKPAQVPTIVFSAPKLQWFPVIGSNWNAQENENGNIPTSPSLTGRRWLGSTSWPRTRKWANLLALQCNAPKAPKSFLLVLENNSWASTDSLPKKTAIWELVRGHQTRTPWSLCT